MSAAFFAALLSAVCWVESNHRPHVVNHHDGGSASIGECQLKMSTAQQMGFTGTRSELLKPEVNRKYAELYLRHQIERYHGDVVRAVSAYNAGTATKANKQYLRKVSLALMEGR